MEKTHKGYAFEVRSQYKKLEVGLCNIKLLDMFIKKRIILYIIHSEFECKNTPYALNFLYQVLKSWDGIRVRIS